MISRPPAIFPSDVKVLEPTAVNVITNIGVKSTTSSSYHLKEKSSTDVLGIVFALGSSMLSAWVTILARQVNHIHYSVQVFWGAVGGVTISVIGMFLIDTSSALFEFWTARTCLLAVGQAFLGLGGTILILKALKWISPTKNKVIRSFQVVGSYIIQVSAFGTIPHVSDYVGAVLIVLAVLGITLEDNIIKLFKL